MASASILRRGLESESVEDFVSAKKFCTVSPTVAILNLNLYDRWQKKATEIAPRMGEEKFADNEESDYRTTHCKLYTSEK